MGKPLRLPCLERNKHENLSFIKTYISRTRCLDISVLIEEKFTASAGPASRGAWRCAMKRALLLNLMLVVLLLGCDQSTEEEAKDDDEDNGDGGAAAADLTLEIGGQSVGIAFSEVTISEVEGFQAVNLGELVDLGFSKGDVSGKRKDYFFDFEGSDGFKPSMKDCDPLPGDTLDDGYIDTDSGNMFWDTSLGLGGCYSVDEVAKIHAIAPDDLPDDEDAGVDGGGEIEPEDPITVTVKYNDDEAEVDLGTLEYYAEGGDVLADLTDVVEASELTTAPEDVLLEPEADDGFKPSVKDCDPLTYDDWKLGRINVDTGDISWPGDHTIGSCYMLDGTVIINLYDPE